MTLCVFVFLVAEIPNYIIVLNNLVNLNNFVKLSLQHGAALGQCSHLECARSLRFNSQLVALSCPNCESVQQAIYQSHRVARPRRAQSRRSPFVRTGSCNARRGFLAPHQSPSTVRCSPDAANVPLRQPWIRGAESPTIGSEQMHRSGSNPDLILPANGLKARQIPYTWRLCLFGIRCIEHDLKSKVCRSQSPSPQSMQLSSMIHGKHSHSLSACR